MKACLHLLISWLVCIALVAIGSGARAEMSPTGGAYAAIKAAANPTSSARLRH